MFIFFYSEHFRTMWHMWLRAWKPWVWMPKTRFSFVRTHRVFLMFLDVSRSRFAVYIPEISCYFWANPVMPAATALRRCLCRCFMAPCRCPTCCRVPLGSHTNSWRGNWWAEVGHSWTVKKDEKGWKRRKEPIHSRETQERMFNGFYMFLHALRSYKVLRDQRTPSQDHRKVAWGSLFQEQLGNTWHL